MNSIQFLANKVDKNEATTNPSDSVKSTHSNLERKSLFYYIFFIPNILIIKPLLFTWFIITFPLSLQEKKLVAPLQESKPVPEQSVSEPGGASGTTEEVEIEVEAEQNDKLTNLNLKSSSLKSKIKFQSLIFPKHVFPKTTQTYKKTLVLDLDETLIHSLSKSTNSSSHMIEVKFNNEIPTLYYVNKRPYCDFFLKQVSSWFNLVIFTASVKEYADPIINYLEMEKKYFQQRLYRNNCLLRDGEGYIKDLNQISKNLNDLIIIDNSPISYSLNESNGILVEGWINDPTDTDLLNLIPLLNGLRYSTDVRSVLSLKNGEIVFEK